MEQVRVYSGPLDDKPLKGRLGVWATWEAEDWGVDSPINSGIFDE